MLRYRLARSDMMMRGDFLKLFPTLFARRAVEFQRNAPTEGASPSAHGERVTLSEKARAASQGASPPVAGDVRWYRAHRGAAARARLAATDVAAPSESPAPPAPPPSGTIAGAKARAAIAAYQAGMALAA